MPRGDTFSQCCWSWLRAWAEGEGTVLLPCCHNPFILWQQPTSPAVLGHTAERRNRNVTSALRSFQAKYLLCTQRASLLRPPTSCLLKASTLICKLKRSILYLLMAPYFTSRNHIKICVDLWKFYSILWFYYRYLVQNETRNWDSKKYTGNNSLSPVSCMWYE